MLPDQEQALLVGTTKGLRRLHFRAGTGQVDTVPTPAEGFSVTLLFRDRLQRCWLGTANGLYLADSV